MCCACSIPSTWVARGQLDVAKLDDLTQPALVEKYKGRVGVLKIDVEGNEHAVGGRHEASMASASYPPGRGEDCALKHALVAVPTTQLDVRGSNQQYESPCSTSQQLHTYSSWVQVLEGALNFFRAVRPPYVTAECSDLMMIRASNKPASEFFRVVSRCGAWMVTYGYLGWLQYMSFVSEATFRSMRQ